MRLIVGLGNPGPDYARTRHNAGFMVADQWIARHRLDEGRERFHALTAQGRVADDTCMVIKPLTYMNRSGLSVGEVVQFFKLEPARDLLVVVDDLALATGRIRLRASGGAGGHNGLLDIERVLGTRDFPRLRIGIDAPGRVPQVDYVLGRFSPDQTEKLGPAIDDACAAIDMWMTEGLAKTMTRFNAAYA